MPCRTIPFLLLAAVTVFAEPRRYEIRPAEGARMELRVYKTGFMRGKVHIFQFPQYQGTLLFDPQKPEASEVSLSISATAIQLLDTWLSPKDFRSVQQYALKDMLAAERFPEITFRSTQIRSVERGFAVTGTLTIQGVAKAVVINVTLGSRSDSGLAIQGVAKLRLTAYGLKPPSAGLGTVGTRDEMEFSVSLLVR